MIQIKTIQNKRYNNDYNPEGIKKYFIKYAGEYQYYIGHKEELLQTFPGCEIVKTYKKL